MRESNRRKNRSDKYQYIIVETIFPYELLDTFSNADSIYGRLNPYAYDERVLELQDELKKEFWRLIDETLTERQKEVVQLSASGLTQMEIAKKLSVNQSSITKSINGNTDYSKEVSERKSYGGIRRKLEKAVESDEKIQKILKEIAELRESIW